MNLEDETRDRIDPTSTIQVVLPGLVDAHGLQVRTVPVPAQGKGQLLVAVEATGISYAEQAMRRGRYFGQPEFPFTPGYDLVGRVADVGPGGDPQMLGARVASVTKTGAWTGHAVVEARDTVLVPDGIAPPEVEAVVVNGVTAWQMLHRSATVRAGQTILVFGANGGVGGILIQIALSEGIRVIGAASPRHHDALHEAGVVPVDYSDPALVERVQEIAPEGLAAVFDNIGGATSDRGWRMLGPGGTLVTYAIIDAVSGSGSLVAPFVRAIAKALVRSLLPNGKKATFYDLWSGHSVRPRRFRRHLEEDLGRVFALLGRREIVPAIAARFPLEQAGEALALAETRTVAGKVVLIP